MAASAVSWHTAPDGRRFRVFVGSCICGPPCWQARCECGEKLTAHDFTEDSAVRCALGTLASSDPRPGFGHAVCRRNRHSQQRPNDQPEVGSSTAISRTAE